MSANQSETAPGPGLGSIVDTILQRTAERSPDLARAVLYCSVPRWFDREVVAGMCPPTEVPAVSSDEILQHLQAAPFCQSHPTRGTAWVFREDFRAHFLSRKEVTDRWEVLCSRAAGTFRQMLDGKGLEGEERFQDRDWRDLAVEWAYHTLCLDLPAGLTVVRQMCAEALATWRIDFCSEFLGALNWPAAAEQPDEGLSSLQAGINALLAYDDVRALDMFYSLVEVTRLAPEQESALRYWIGTTHLRDEGRLAPALEQLERARRLTPDDASVHAEIAAVYYRPGPIWGRLDLALQHANEAKELAPEEATGYLALGRVQEQQENWDAAIGWYQKALQADPTALAGYLALSEAYAARRDVTHAIEMIDKAVEINPNVHYFALIRRGDVYRDARKYGESQREYEQARDEAPDRIEAYIQLGSLYAALGQSVKAEGVYRKAIELRPELGDGYVALARLYDQQGKWERAVSTCRQAVDQGIRAKDLYIMLSGLYGGQGQIEDLRWAQAQLAQLDSEEEYAAHCAVSDALFAIARRRTNAPDRGRWLEQARGECEEALENDPNRAWAYTSLAELSVLRKDEDAVREQQRLVSERAPWAQYDMLVNLGQAYLSNFQYAESERALEAAIKLAPHRMAAWRALNDLYRWQGNLAGVMRAWSELVRLDPTLAYEAHISTGMAHQQIADYAQAYAEYARAKDVEPDTAVAYVWLAEADYARGEWEDAVANYRRAADKASDSAAVAYARIAAIRRAQGRYDEAEKAARTAIRFDAEQADGYVELACLGAAVQQRRQLIEEARESMAAVLPGKLYDLDYAVGDVYRLAGQYEKARQAYGKCRKRDAERADAYVGLGRVAVGRGQYAEARDYLNQALGMDSTNVGAYSGLSELYHSQGDVQGVVEAWDCIVRLEPSTQYSAYLEVGATYEKVGKPDAAEQQYRAAIVLSPWRPDGYVHLASLLRKCGRPGEAESAYQQAKEVAGVDFLELGGYYEQQKEPEDAIAAYRLSIEYEAPALAYNARLSIGNLLAAQRKYEEAEEVYRQAIEVDPKRVDGYLRLASLYQERNDLATMERCVLQALAVAPDDPGAHWTLAQLREQQEQWDEAVRLYRRVAELQPDAASAAYERVGDLLIGQERFGEAEEALQSAVRSDPDNAGAHFSLGVIYERRGDLEQAVAMYRRATEILPTYGDAYIALGRMYGRQGDVGSLAGMARRIMELDLEPAEQYDAHLVAAAAYRQAGDLKQAEETCRQAINAYPKRPEAYVDLAQLLAGQGRFEEAEEALQNAVQNDPANAGTYLTLGMVCEQRGDLTEAIEAYTKAIEIAPKYGDAYVALVRAYGRQRDVRSLGRMARRLPKLGLEPVEQYEARMALAAAYQAAGNAKRAEETYQQAIAAHPKGPQAYISLAQSLADQGQLDEAIQVCQQMAQEPDLVYDARLSIGNLLAAQRKYEEAKEVYRQAIEVDPKRVDGYLVLASLYQERNDLATMERYVLQALAVAPDDPGAHRALAQLREQQEQWDEAVRLYRRVAELQPDAASAAYERVGDLLIGQERFGEAEEALQSAVRSDPDNAGAHFSLGVIYERRGDLEQAVAMYRRATEILPTYGDAYIALGRMYGRQGDVGSLAGMARRIMELGLKPAEQYDAHLVIAAAYHEAGLYEWAIAELNKAVALDPDRLGALIPLGQIYEIQQRWAKARDVYEKIGRLSPELRPDVHLKLGQLMQQENLDGAEDEYRQAINLAPERLDVAAPAYLSLGDIYRGLGEIDEMREVCARVVSLVESAESPDYNALRHQGLAHFMRGEYTEAAQVLGRAVEANPTEPKVRFYLALTLLGLGAPAQARAELDRGTRLAQHRGDYWAAIEEAEALAARVPEVAGAKEMLQALTEARDKSAQ